MINPNEGITYFISLKVSKAPPKKRLNVSDCENIDIKEQPWFKLLKRRDVKSYSLQLANFSRNKGSFNIGDLAGIEGV